MNNSDGIRKNFVLDTNVLLHDPKAISKFENNTVIIPIYVIEEIDTFKRSSNELGRNARQVCRFLDDYRQQGNLGVGVKMENGGFLKVSMTPKKLPVEVLEKHLADNLIMAVALDVKEKEPNVPCILVTKDTNLRIRADALGLLTENYENNNISLDQLYPGSTEILTGSTEVDDLYSNKLLDIAFSAHPKHTGGFTLGGKPLGGPELEEAPIYFSNEYVLLKDQVNPSHTALGRIVPKENKIVALRNLSEGVWGVRPRNKEQHFALDCLLNDDIKLVTLLGKAGTGKTLLALAAALQKVAEEEKYSKLLVARPIFPLGKDLGYLPGSVEEKLNPWMQPIFDNVEYLMGLTQADKRSGRSYQELIDLSLLQIEPLTYIRGRSIPQQYIIIDEAQNLTPHEVKTIITRVGNNTKIVLTGDPHQIDNPYVDSESNGLTYLISKFQGQSISATVTLHRGERSELAELAANLL